MTLDLEVPSLPGLDPIDPVRLASFRLRREDNLGTVAEARFAPGGPIDVGGIPTGPSADYDLEGLTSGGQIIALGRVRGLGISASSDVSMTVHLRKPVGYVAGGSAVRVRDATLAGDKLDDIAQPSAATGLTSTHDGTALLVATGATIAAFSTGTEMPIGTPVTVREPASVLVVDATDGMLAALGATGVTFVPLGGLAGTGEPAAGLVTVDLPGAPVAAAFGLDGQVLYAIVGAPGCGAPGCLLFTIDVASGGAGTPATLPEAAADLVVEQATGLPVLALPGMGALVRFDPAAGALAQAIVSIPAARQIASVGGTLVGFGDGDTRSDSNCPRIGPPGGPSAVVVLASGAQTVGIKVPPFIGTFSRDPRAPNQTNASVSTAGVSIRRAAVTPDASRALVWATADYCGDLNVESPVGTICQGQVVARDEYLLVVDLQSGLTISAEPTAESVSTCSLDCGLITLDCRGRADVSGFVPAAVSVLFGGK